MPEVMTAANVQDAVELAQKLKAEGRYDWFRGQVRDWPPVSTLHRLHAGGDAQAIERAVRRFDLFGRWLSETPELEHLLSEDGVHPFFAVAQHYGIPTHYIDFTTDPAVAGFFAADTKTPPADDGMSCIYLLDSEELREVAADLQAVGGREGAHLETIEIDVGNLWRLQAQRGVFLFSEYNWDVDFPMDRIVFPYTGYPAYPPAAQIYPREKSALEHLLDQYFDLERKHFSARDIHRMIAELRAKGANASLNYFEDRPDGFYRDGMVDPDSVRPVASWSPVRTEAWRTYPQERFDDLGGPTERIRVSGTDRAALERDIGYGVRQILEGKPKLRTRLVEWAVDGALPEGVPAERLGDLFRAAWNGMRALPFSNAQIATAFANTAGLLAAGFGTASESSDRRIFAEIHGDAIHGDALRVEFGYADNSSSRGYASKARLLALLRDDLPGMIVPQHRDRLGELNIVFQLVMNPALLFDFDAFADLFAAQVIPAQLVEGREPTLFNPAKLRTFGLP